MESQSVACEYASVEGPLRVFARALSGRRGGAHNPSLGFDHADDIPPVVDLFPTHAENRAWYKVSAAHRALHHAAGTFSLDWDVEPTQFEPLLERLDVPGGTSDLWAFFGLFTERELAAALFAHIEDLRIEQILRIHYPGLAGPLSRIQRAWIEQRPPLEGLPLRTAMVELLARLSLNDWDVTVPARYGTQAGILAAVLRSVLDPSASVRDSAEATLRLYSLITGLPNYTPERPGKAISVERVAGEVDLPRWPTAWPEPPRPRYEGSEALQVEVPHPEYRDRLVQRSASRRPVPASGDQGVYSIVETWEEISDPEATPTVTIDEVPENLDPGHLSEHTIESQHHHHTHWTDYATPTPSAIEDGPLSSEGTPDVFTYPEWDAIQNRLRPDWCLVRERQLTPSGSAAAHRAALRTHGRLLPRIRRGLESISPEALRTVRRVTDGTDIDLDAAIEALVDVRARVTPSEQVYVAHQRVQRDVAAAFLLDLSASTAEHIKNVNELEAWTTAPRRIIDLERIAASLLTYALSRTGDVFGIFGFSSSGRDKVEVVTVKDMGEKVSDRVLRRIDNLNPMHGTRMGAALRHVTRKLAPLDNRTKLLFLVSDGRPHDVGYGHEYEYLGRGAEYATSDTRKALESARAVGVRPFCLTVDASGNDYLRDMCGDLPYEVLSDVTALPARLVALYEDILTGRVSTVMEVAS